MIARSKLAALLSLSLLWLGHPAVADDDSTPSEHGCPLVSPLSQTWEFGMKITANSPAAGITVTIPIPCSWPEQQILQITEHQSDTVSRISFKNLPNNARQMVFRVNRLAAGESAKATVRIRMTKHHLGQPPAPAQLKFADKVPSKYRQFLRPSPYIESNHKRIKAIAAELKPAEGKSDYAHAEMIYNWVRKNIEYEFDTTIRSCLDALDAKKGDCEELASLFVAICRAQGIPARTVWIPGHTYPEFLMFDKDGKPCWIPCQIAGSYEFGAMSEDKPILQKGDRFKIPGDRKTVRYVKPTILAKDSSGGFKTDWIMSELANESKKAGTEKQSGSGGLLRGGK